MAKAKLLRIKHHACSLSQKKQYSIYPAGSPPKAAGQAIFAKD
jgi:hypothetical protein